MMFLGICTSPKVVRCALVEWDGTAAKLLNVSSDNKLDFPATYESIEEKTEWLYSEINRILKLHPDIEKIGIKVSEFLGSDSWSKRESIYLDAVISLVSAQAHIPIEKLIYAGIGTKRADVKAFSEARVGKTDTYWNESMAGAVAAAYRVRAK